MPIVNPGEIWMIDFGMVAKVRPALLLTGTPADDELDIVTVLLQLISIEHAKSAENGSDLIEASVVAHARQIRGCVQVEV